MQRIAAGDREALARFYDRCSTLLFSVASRILNDADEAEDVVLEVCVQIWDKADTFNPALGKPVIWALTLTRNQAIDRLRSRDRQSRLPDAAAPPAAAPGSVNDTVGPREKTELISSVWNALPNDQRRALEVVYFTGFTQLELAELLREAPGAIRGRIRRAMFKLREGLEGRL